MAIAGRRSELDAAARPGVPGAFESQGSQYVRVHVYIQYSNKAGLRVYICAWECVCISWLACLMNWFKDAMQFDSVFVLQSCWTVCGPRHLCPPPAPRPPRAATPKGRTRRAARGRPAKMSERGFCASTSGTSPMDRYIAHHLSPAGRLDLSAYCFSFLSGGVGRRCASVNAPLLNGMHARALHKWMDGNSRRLQRDHWYFWTCSARLTIIADCQLKTLTSWHLLWSRIEKKNCY
jgi:hypothetical protein